MSAPDPGAEQPAPQGSQDGSAPDTHAPGERPMHPSVVPTGEHVAHSAIGSLLGGVIVWGGVGLLLDHWLGTGRVWTAVGVVVGSLTGFLIVYLRFGRDE
jgi:ATP synthase protein I